MWSGADEWTGALLSLPTLSIPMIGLVESFVLNDSTDTKCYTKEVPIHLYSRNNPCLWSLGAGGTRFFSNGCPTNADLDQELLFYAWWVRTPTQRRCSCLIQ